MWSHPDILYVGRRLRYIIRISMAVKFIDNFEREVETLIVEVLTNVHKIENRRVAMLRKQSISGFLLRNDLVVHARYSVLALFVVLSSAVIKLRNTDVLAGP
jgi:hypothetical protein